MAHQSLRTMPLADIDCYSFSSQDVLTLYARLRDDAKCPAKYKDMFLMLAEEAASCRDDAQNFDEVAKLCDKTHVTLESLRSFLKGDRQAADTHLNKALSMMGYTSLPELQHTLRVMEKLVHESTDQHTERSPIKRNGGTTRSN